MNISIKNKTKTYFDIVIERIENIKIHTQKVTTGHLFIKSPYQILFLVERAHHNYSNFSEHKSMRQTHLSGRNLVL